MLAIDELGYVSYCDSAANLLFHVVNARHVKRRSIVFTTNKALADWGVALHDRDLAAAIIDRVLERGRYVPLEGPSVESRGSAPTVAGGSSRLPTGFRIAPVPQSPA